MKKRLFCYLFAACCAAVVLPSCSDDEAAPDYTQVIENDLAGEYKGELDIKIDGTLLGSDIPQNITVAKAGASAVTLSLKNFSFAGIQIGDIEMKDCLLTADGDGYTFASEQELKVPGLTCTIHAVGTLAKGGKVLLKMDIDALLGEVKQKVEVVYEGSRLKGDEKTEAKMLTFTFDAANEKNACVIEQPVMGEDHVITFRVNEEMVTANPDLLKSLEPTVTFSEDASVSSTLDGEGFSKDVTYTVLSEDGKTKTTYTVKKPFQGKVLVYSFEEWEEKQGNLNTDAGFTSFTYHLPMPKDQLASSAEGANMLGLFGIEGMPVYKSDDDKKVGTSAIKLVTMDTKAKASILVPALTSGSVYTGKFNMEHAMTDKMKCTEFGISYDRKPVTFRGWYKYTPGEVYINGEGATKPEDVKVVEGKVDECAVMAVLYEEELNEEGKNIPLNGHNINESPRHVAVAMLADGTAKAEWTHFEIPFTFVNGKSYDASKKYYIAIVCSSSKLGDRFQGAGGSTLLLDELEVIGE